MYRHFLAQNLWYCPTGWTDRFSSDQGIYLSIVQFGWYLETKKKPYFRKLAIRIILVDQIDIWN